MSRHEVESCCAYCGLPLPTLSRRGTPTRVASADGAEHSRSNEQSRDDQLAPQYCCFGCRFAAEVTRSHGEHGHTIWNLTKLGFAIFFTMNVMMFSMALWSQDLEHASRVEVGVATGAIHDLIRWLCMLLALPVLLLAGGPIVENALASLRTRRANMDLLLMMGVFSSYLYSALSVLRGRGPIYFEVGCMVLVLVTLGRWLEAVGRVRAGEAIESLHKLLPETARVLSGDSETVVALSDVAVGDHIRVVSGERIPIDGRVAHGTAAVDEQVLTGESSPISKEPGALVSAGTTNLDGELVIDAMQTAHNGTLSRMIELVRRARQLKGRYECLADWISAWFVPATALVAISTFAFHTLRDGMEQGILSGMAVLLIACPCALGLATPMAVWTALGQAARGQVLFRDGMTVERLASVRAIRLDKTGTLTTGTPSVAQVITDDGVDRATMVATAARLASASTHSLARAIRDYATHELEGKQKLGISLNDVRTLPGRGVIAICGSSPDLLSMPFRYSATALLGSVRLMTEQSLHCRDRMQRAMEQALRSGQALTCVGWGGEVRGLFLFHEQLRPEAYRAVGDLQQMGLDVRVLTGDHATRGAAMEQALSRTTIHERYPDLAAVKIPVDSELIPEGKVEAIIRAREAFGPVAMIGDGINDAPALAASDVGIAMGCGADVSRDSAAICLLGNDLLRVPWAIRLARQAVRVIRQNLFWSFAYNVIGIGFACTGQLNPIWAAVAMVLSSLLVVTNSLRLGGVAPERGQESFLYRQGAHGADSVPGKTTPDPVLGQKEQVPCSVG